MNRHKHEVGVAFCSWFGDIKKFAKRDAIKDELELSDARPLDDVYQRLHSTLNGQFVTPDAAAVVADFEQLCLPPNVEACFLRLVKLALRERLPQLIAAMAQASRRETRLIALRIAATNPILCDAWASGAAGGINGLQIDSLPSLPSPATEALALAFFRRLEVDEGTTKRAIDQMWRYLSDETRAVWKFLQHGATSAGQRTLLEKFGWRGLERAIDAGAELSADIQSMQRYGLDEPEFWWLLATMTPNARFLSDLLKLDARFRAIVGLCTDAEIQQLRQDTALWNAVCHCRRHVPLGTRTN